MSAGLEKRYTARSEEAGKGHAMKEDGKMMSIGAVMLNSPEIVAIIEKHDPSFRAKLEARMAMSEAERSEADYRADERAAARLNGERGDLDKEDGYDCAACLNRGVLYEAVRDVDGMTRIVRRDCACKKARASLRRMRASGLSNHIARCRMDNFQTDEAWQRGMKERALMYLADENPAWWFVGGAVGAGKTHISTAICRTLIGRGLEVVYMIWTDEITHLKGIRFDEPAAYKQRMEKLKGADVLYIDDLYKRTPDRDRISDADVLILYDILNHRYMRKARTLITSERTLNEIMKLDEGIGSRIAQMAKGYVISIDAGAGKNRRLRG